MVPIFFKFTFCSRGNECAKKRTVGYLCYTGCIKINGKKINFQIEMTVEHMY